jgi:hypothetical protein
MPLAFSIIKNTLQIFARNKMQLLEQLVDLVKESKQSRPAVDPLLTLVPTAPAMAMAILATATRVMVTAAKATTAMVPQTMAA